MLTVKACNPGALSQAVSVQRGLRIEHPSRATERSLVKATESGKTGTEQALLMHKIYSNSMATSLVYLARVSYRFLDDERFSKVWHCTYDISNARCQAQD